MQPCGPFGYTQITAARVLITEERALNSDIENFLLCGGITCCVSISVSSSFFLSLRPNPVATKDCKEAAMICNSVRACRPRRSKMISIYLIKPFSVKSLTLEQNNKF